jgi:hypothetical protein
MPMSEPVPMSGETSGAAWNGPDDLRAATFTGRDPGHLATAVVDGQGLLVRITFATTVGMHAPPAVEDAVRSAVAAAVQAMNDAWLALDPQANLSEDDAEARR